MFHKRSRAADPVSFFRIVVPRCPLERAVHVVSETVSLLPARAMLQKETGHLGVALKHGEIQRGRALVASSYCNWPPEFDHDSHRIRRAAFHQLGKLPQLRI